MNVEQATRLAVAFACEAANAPAPRLCRVCVDVLAVTGAGITIMGGDHAGPICVSNPDMKALEDLQFTVGEGPCRDAFRTGMAVHAPRLDAEAWSRWPPFVDLANASGIGAAFAYPLMTKGVTVGVLTLYQQAEGELSVIQNEDGLALAEILAETLLSLQDAAPQGTLAAGLEGAVAYRAEIYQASGIVAIQLRIPPPEALLRIRAYAFAHNQAVDVVAADIVARRLRLHDDHGEPEEQA